VTRIETAVREAEGRIEELRRESEALRSKDPELDSVLRTAKQQRAECAAQFGSSEDQLRKDHGALQESLSRAQSSHENVVRASRESAGADSKREELSKQRAQGAE
jgi:chromosome segregation ATPase